MLLFFCYETDIMSPRLYSKFKEKKHPPDFNLKIKWM